MIKIFTALAVIITLWGCSNDNKITIQNLAQETIYLNFRASLDSVFSGGTITLTEIPNGTYLYNTTYRLPFGATSSSSSGDAAGGQLTFDKKITKILMLYSSTFMAGVYTLMVNITSSEPINSTSPTSIQ